MDKTQRDYRKLHHQELEYRLRTPLPQPAANIHQLRERVQPEKDNMLHEGGAFLSPPSPQLTQQRSRTPTKALKKKNAYGYMKRNYKGRQRNKKYL
eukprot:2071979-Amphidinium_carterae.4